MVFPLSVDLEIGLGEALAHETATFKHARAPGVPRHVVGFNAMQTVVREHDLRALLDHGGHDSAAFSRLGEREPKIAGLERPPHDVREVALSHHSLVVDGAKVQGRLPQELPMPFDNEVAHARRRVVGLLARRFPRREVILVLEIVGLEQRALAWFQHH